MKFALIQIVVLIASMALYTLYGQLAWNWHLAPIIGWNITYAETFGILAVFGLFMPVAILSENRSLRLDNDELGNLEAFITHRAESFGYHTMLFVIAWLATFFI